MIERTWEDLFPKKQILLKIKNVHLGNIEQDSFLSQPD